MIAKVQVDEIRRDAIQTCINGSNLKQLKILIENEIRLSSPAQKVESAAIKKRGRALQRVHLGTTAKTNVVKRIVLFALSQPDYVNYQKYFANVGWSELTQATKAFRKLTTYWRMKVSNNKIINKSLTTTAKLPKLIQQVMLERVVKDGYGLKGKSRWIGESIERFLQLPNYPELVDIADEMQEMTDVASISLSTELLKKLDHAVIQVRTQYPAMEGVKSKIIRASIMQRLLRP